MYAGCWVLHGNQKTITIAEKELKNVHIAQQILSGLTGAGCTDIIFCSLFQSAD